MMLTVIDHSEPNWFNLYTSSNRENGAATYSKEIVRHQLPVWHSHTEGLTGVISTCPLLYSCPGIPVSGDLAVQYLHTYAYDEPLKQAQLVVDHLPGYDRILFVTSYRALYLQLLNCGYEALYVPMTIEPASVLKPMMGVPGRRNKAAYWGNVTSPKRALYRLLKKEFREQGWELEHVWGQQYSSWEELTAYEYGVGVGRCALEMMSLGLKVMIAGSKFGGLITNEEEYNIQSYSNFNGRIITFDRSVAACINSWSLSEVLFKSGPEVAVDSLTKQLPVLLKP